jgi:hypothetical protein
MTLADPVAAIEAPPVACATAVTFIVPRLQRVESDLDALHTASRRNSQTLDALDVAHRDHDKRVAMLERFHEEQHLENVRMNAAVQKLQTAVQDICHKLSQLLDAQAVTNTHLDAHHAELQELFVKQAKSSLEDVDRYRKKMKVWVAIASALAVILVVVSNLHAMHTGESLLTSLAGWFKILL